MSRNWLATLLAALTLVIAAGCGPAVSETEEPPTPEPTATTAPTDTAEPEEPTAYDVAKQYEGAWTGSWHNDTYDTTGSADVTVAVRPDGTFDVTMDIGGMVFGAIDPPALTFYGTYEADAGAAFGALDDPTFGDATVIITPDGQLSGSLQGLMGGAGILEVTGTVTPERVDLQYSIPIFPATGTLTLEHQ